MEMRSLYPVRLPTERAEGEDLKQHNDAVMKNEDCLNRNFTLLAEKIYEFEARIAYLEQCMQEE